MRGLDYIGLELDLDRIPKRLDGPERVEWIRSDRIGGRDVSTGIAKRSEQLKLRDEEAREEKNEQRTELRGGEGTSGKDWTKGIEGGNQEISVLNTREFNHPNGTDY